MSAPQEFRDLYLGWQLDTLGYVEAALLSYLALSSDDEDAPGLRLALEVVEGVMHSCYLEHRVSEMTGEQYVRTKRQISNLRGAL